MRQVAEEFLCSVFPILEFHHEGAKLQIPGCKHIHTHTGTVDYILFYSKCSVCTYVCTNLYK